MLEEKNLEEQIADTEIKIGNFSFTPMKLMLAGSIVSAVVGTLWGGFEIYKDYMDMKEAIQTYVAPDLSEINKKLAIVEENSAKSTDYTRDIKNDLKADIRRLEEVVEQVERNTKQSQRDMDNAVKDSRTDMSKLDKDLRSEMTRIDKENDGEFRKLRKDVDDKIKKALDNPLAN
jgi:uncharacterized phage infection (PIP) family protein YhgE